MKKKNNNEIIFVKINNNVKYQKNEKERNKEKETRIISGYEKTIFWVHANGSNE